MWIFFAEYGAPRKGRTTRNAPPDYAHINVVAESPARGPSDGEPRTWGGREGLLIHGPDYPRGGMEGGHLIFEWNQNGIGYSISIHAWDPLAEAEDALREMVESLRRKPLPRDKDEDVDFLDL